MRGQEDDVVEWVCGETVQVIEPHEGSGVVLQVARKRKLQSVIEPHEGSGEFTPVDYRKPATRK